MHSVKGMDTGRMSVRRGRGRSQCPCWWRRWIRGVRALWPPERGGNVGRGGQPVDFLVDTGATFSILKEPVGPVSKECVPIQGATGKVQSYPWTKGQITNLGTGQVTHSFLVMPDCPYSLLGQDLLTKLKATISFEEGEINVRLGRKGVSLGVFLITLLQEEEYRLHEEPRVMPCSLLEALRREIPQVWAEDNPPGLASHRPPIVVQLTSSTTPFRVKQYPRIRRPKGV